MDLKIKEMFNDLDFEAAQAMVESEKNLAKKIEEKRPEIDKEKDRKDKPQEFEKERFAKRDKDRGKYRNDNRRDYKRRDYREKSGSRERDNRSKQNRSRKNSFQNDDKIRKEKEYKKKEKLTVEKTIEEARWQALEAQRDDCTILMYRLAQAAKEHDVFNFLCNANIGRIVDIKLIRDPRNGKPKGVCYVEFESRESVLLAVGLSGAPLCGQPVSIVSSQAEKNRHAAAAKYKKEQIKEQQRINSSRPAEPTDLSDVPMKIYVGGLTEHLADITETDLQNIFPFGEIDYIDLHRDTMTGKCKGYAFIQFRKTSQAKAAISAMNGFHYKGKILRVGEAHESSRTVNEFLYTGEIDDEALQTIQGKTALMQKLSRGITNQNDSTVSQLPALHPINKQYTIGEATVSQSACILLSNLFDPREVDLEKEPEFYTETYEDVVNQSSNFGRVESAWVDQNSMGNAWVKFSDNQYQAAAQAVEKLNGRWFASRPISAKLVAESTYNATVPMKNESKD